MHSAYSRQALLPFQKPRKPNRNGRGGTKQHPPSSTTNEREGVTSSFGMAYKSSSKGHDTMSGTTKLPPPPKAFDRLAPFVPPRASSEDKRFTAVLPSVSVPHESVEMSQLSQLTSSQDTESLGSTVSIESEKEHPSKDIVVSLFVLLTAFFLEETGVYKLQAGSLSSASLSGLIQHWQSRSRRSFDSIGQEQCQSLVHGLSIGELSKSMHSFIHEDARYTTTTSTAVATISSTQLGFFGSDPAADVYVQQPILQCIRLGVYKFFDCYGLLSLELGTFVEEPVQWTRSADRGLGQDRARSSAISPSRRKGDFSSRKDEEATREGRSTEPAAQSCE